MAESYNPENLWAPFGAFSMMMLQGGGQVVHLKGQISLDKDGQVVGAKGTEGDMQAQLRQTLTNIETALASVGGRMSDVTSLVHYTTDIASFMQSGDVRKAFFAEPYPITTTVETAALYRPELLIEITATAEIPLDRFARPAAARSLHG